MGGIERFLDRRIDPVDLVDEQHIARLEIGEERREIAGLSDHGAGGRAEIDRQLARHDLRKRGLAEARRPDEEHVIERLAATFRCLDEDPQIAARLLLPDELGEQLRAQGGLGGVLFAPLGGNETARRRAHRASSLRPSRMSRPVSASPASRAAAATAAAACG
jgi:hypothetical protein